MSSLWMQLLGVQARIVDARIDAISRRDNVLFSREQPPFFLRLMSVSCSKFFVVYTLTMNQTLSTPLRVLRTSIKRQFLEKCPILAISAHNMVPRTHLLLQDRSWDNPRRALHGQPEGCFHRIEDRGFWSRWIDSDLDGLIRSLLPSHTAGYEGIFCQILTTFPLPYP